MQLSDLRAQVRRHLAEPSTDVFSDALINAKLNRSQNDLAAQYALIQKNVSLNISGSFVQLPTDFIHPGEDRPKIDGNEIRRIDLNDLMLMDPLALTTSSQSGIPRYYVYEESLTLGASPTVPSFGIWPSGIGLLSFTYAAMPVTMTTDSDVPWNSKYEPFHELIAMHAANALQIEQGSSAAGNSVFYSIFMRRKEELRAHMARGKVGKRMTLKSNIGKGGWH